MSESENRWLLPEGIEELLPPEAAALDLLRRRLVDLFSAWGYELVIPPLVEYLESLLTGTGNDLDLRTFKLTDQLTGRMMGVRADMTPQVARIDSHRLKEDRPTRLCYLGTVLHTRPPAPGGSRTPYQVGAELYGHRGIESDLEVLRLMVETLHAAGLSDLHLDLGHVGIYRGLVKEAGLTAEAETILFDALQRKAEPELRDWLARLEVAPPHAGMLLALASLNGGEEALDEAQGLLRRAGAPVREAFANLRALAQAARRIEGVTLHFDLAELRGYRYHTGAVFAAFVPGKGQAVAQGGRYDDIGGIFGRARPATGFSTDLRALLPFFTDRPPAVRGIFAPPDPDPELEARIAALRRAGERVIQALPGQQGGAAAMGCDRVMERRGGVWEAVPAVE